MAESARCYVQRYDNLSDVSTAEAHWNSQGRANGKYYGCDDPRKVKLLKGGPCTDTPPVSECVANPECHAIGQKSNGCWHLLKYSSDVSGHSIPGPKYRRWDPVRDPGTTELDVSFTTPDFLGAGQGAVKRWVAKINEVSTNPILTTAQNIKKRNAKTDFGKKTITLVPRSYTISLGYETVGGQFVYPSGWRKGFTVEGDNVMSPESVRVVFAGSGASVSGTKDGFMTTYYYINSLTSDASAKTYGDIATCKMMAESKAAKDRNVYAWGHRNTSHPSEAWRNTCFFYSPYPGHYNSIEQPMGLRNPSYLKSMCVDPSKSIFLGCRERDSGVSHIIPPNTRLGVGNVIYSSNRMYALQLIQDRGVTKLMSINMNNGTSNTLIDYSSLGNLGTLTVLIFRQGIELLHGWSQTVKRRSPSSATLSPSIYVTYDFEFDSSGRLKVNLRISGFFSRYINLATYS